MKNTKKVRGFTLVELIVVITILAILGVIAFTNLGNFSNSARDSVRISDLTNITQGLELTLIKNGTVPPPSDNTLTLSASGTIIGYQGYFGPTNLSQIHMSDAKDPTDNKYYTYSTNLSYTKYQLLSLLEDPSTLTYDGSSPFKQNSFPLIPQAHAGYETRIPTTKGSQLGILLNNTGNSLNQPIQELYNTASFTGVDVVNTMTGYIAIFNNSTNITGTGVRLQYLQVPYTDTKVCSSSPIVIDIENNVYNTILIGTQCWMKSNLRTTKKPDGSAITKGPSAQGAAGWTTDSGYYSCPPNSTNTAEDCISTTLQTYGLLYQWSAAMNTGTTNITNGGQGICPSGWHVPTNTEFKTLIESQATLGCDGGVGAAAWECANAASKLTGGINWTTYTGGIWKDDSNVIRPEFGTSGWNVEPSGYRKSDGIYYYRGESTDFWSSTTYDITQTWRRAFSNLYPSIYRDHLSKTYGFSLRCLKD